MTHHVRLLVALLAVLGLTFAACGVDEETDDGATSINVVLNNNQAGVALEQLIDDFRAEHPDIEVTTDLLAEQQMRDRQQLNLQSESNAMDVFMTLTSREGPMFVNSGYYEPLDDYSDPTSDDLDEMAPLTIDASTIEGSLVALPMNVEGPIMYYRSDLLAEAGLEVPTTIDELMEAAAALQETSDGSWVPITLRGQADAMAYDFGPFFHAQDLEWVTDGHPNFDTPGAVEAIDQYATLARDYGPEGVVNYNFQESSNLFGSGGAAINLESSNELATLSDENTSSVVDDTAATTFPGGVPSVISWSLAMSPFSEDKDAAWTFMTWATSADTQLEMAKLGVAPPREELYDDPEFLDSLSNSVQEESFEAARELLTIGHPELGPVSRQAPAIRRIMGDAVGSVIFDVMTPQEAADAIQDELVGIYSTEQ